MTFRFSNPVPGASSALGLLMSDVRYATRTLIKRPAFAIAVVATLSAGLGVTATVFSVVNAVVIRRLPFDRPDQLVAVWERDERSTQVGADRSDIAPANIADWRRMSHTFASLAEYAVGTSTLTEGGEPEGVSSAAVSASFMSLLRVRPLAGRVFLPADAEPTAERVVVLSERLWRRRFGADPGVVNRLVRIDDSNHRIIGILPQDREFPRVAELWTALRSTPAQSATRSAHYLRAIGRLRADTRLDEAQAELSAIARQLQWQYPQTNTGAGIHLVPLQDEANGSVREALLVLLGAVGFLLLIACASVGGLFLARSAARESEMALRAALGASRGRILQQLFVESLLLSLMAAALGLVLAAWGTRLVMAASPVALMPASGTVSVDRGVVLFAAALSVATAIAFAIVSSLGATGRLSDRLTGGGRQSLVRPAQARGRRLLVGAEIALTMMLLAGAGLLLRTLAQLHRVDLGFVPGGVATTAVRLPAARYPIGSHADRVFARIIGELESIPGVRSAAAVFMLPFGRDNRIYSFRKADQPDKTERANFRVATPGYFATMGVPFTRGRDFGPADTAEGPLVVIVNQTMARHFWPNESAIGRRIFIRGHTVAAEVIGVVDDVKYFGHDSPPEPEMYVPHAQFPANAMTLVFRTSSTTEPLDRVVAERVHAIDRELPVGRVTTMTQLVEDSLAVRRFTRLLLTGFAGLGLLLSCLGLYALVSYSVARRTTEIGIRMALGARPSDVLRLVAAEGLSVAGAGVLMGGAAALGLGRALSSFVFGVKPSDPGVLVAAAFALGLAAVVATVLPAMRALGITPARALTGD